MPYFLLVILWFIITAKVFLFYIYLWQLKEYHIRRFIDHFRTDKGRRLILNKLFFIKLIIFIFLSQRFALFLWLLIILYVIEFLFILENTFQAKLKRPVLTFKTGFLITIGLFVEIIFFLIILFQAKNIFFLTSGLLLFDILSPLIISLIILIFQPLVVLVRDQFILEKAREKRKEHKELIAIGITGSYGKTSTKEFLAAILSEKFNVLKTKEHQNSEVGISQCVIKELKPEHQIFIAEMGAYNKGGIKLLAGIVKPRIGILTGINEQHLALFGSQEKIIKTKYELIESLTDNGLAVFNGDNEYCSQLFDKTLIPKKIYKLSPESDIWADNIRIEIDSVSFKAITKKGEEADFKVNVLGRHNIIDILGAILVANELGMSLSEISRAVFRISQEQGAMKLLKEKDNPAILDASYSANPDGVIADLDYLAIWSNKKFIVMPCLIELGRVSEKVHKKIGKKIGQVCDLAIVTTKEKFKDIKEGAMEAGMEPENIVFSPEPDRIINQIRTLSNPGDVVLLEGRIPKEVIELLKK